MTNEEALRLTPGGQLRHAVTANLTARGVTGERLDRAVTMFVSDVRAWFNHAGEPERLEVGGRTFMSAASAVGHWLEGAAWALEGAMPGATSKAPERALIDMSTTELAMRAHIANAAQARASEGKK